MLDNAGKYYVINGEIVEADAFKDLETPESKVVYEVVRVIDGVPLFLEDHYIRMQNSLNLLGFRLNITQHTLNKQIAILTGASGLSHCNVKITVYSQPGVQDFLLYISKSYYPSTEEYASGVHLGLLTRERENPNVKLINEEYRKAVSMAIEEKKVFEVLLVNQAGEITEGSKSNVFFVKGHKVYTAPGDQVLKGVTRKYIIEACMQLGLEVVESFIRLDALKEIEGLFISGTSIKVLPVARVEQDVFGSSGHAVITAIMQGYDRLLEEYIREHRV